MGRMYICSYTKMYIHVCVYVYVYVYVYVSVSVYVYVYVYVYVCVIYAYIYIYITTVHWFNLPIAGWHDLTSRFYGKLIATKKIWW